MSEAWEDILQLLVIVVHTSVPTADSSADVRGLGRHSTRNGLKAPQLRRGKTQTEKGRQGKGEDKSKL